VKLHLPPPNRALGASDVLGLLGLVGLLVARYIPVARLIPFWGCAFRQQTGWPCLGCGLTRVADRVAHFHFASAWAANPLGTVAAFAFALLAVLTVLHLVFALPVPRLELSDTEWQRVRLGAIALILVNYAWVVVVTKFPHLLA
jgi:hypothetical protein